MNSKMNSEMQTEPTRVDLVTIPLAYSLPGGGEATGYVTVTPAVTQGTLDALRCRMEAGAAQSMAVDQSMAAEPVPGGRR